MITNTYHGCKVTTTLDPDGEQWEYDKDGQPTACLCDGFSHEVHGPKGDYLGRFGTLALALACTRSQGELAPVAPYLEDDAEDTDMELTE